MAPRGPKPLRKRIKHAVAYVLLRGVWGVLARCPEKVLHLLALLLGRLLALTPLRGAAVANIQRAYGHTAPSERFPTADALARACLTHYALTLMEAVLLDRWQGVLLQNHVRVPPGLPAQAAELLQRGRGVVVASGHLGNWELLGRTAAALGFDVWSLAKEPFDGRVSAWLQAWRARGGVKVANRGHLKAVKTVRDHVAQGGALGALVDVDTPVKSAWVPFFGRPAKTPTAAADLTLRFGAPLVVLWSWRESFGVHSGGCVEIAVERTHDAQEDVRRITAQVTAVLEAAIRAHPEQWIWTHSRFKSAPPPKPLEN